MLVFTSVLHFCTKQANFVASGIFIQNLMWWKWIYEFNQKFEAFKSRLLWIFHKYSILACNIRTVFDTIGSSVVVKTFLASLCTTWDFLPQKGKVMQERTRTNPVCKSIWKLMSPFEASIINQTTATTYYSKWKILTFSNWFLGLLNYVTLARTDLSCMLNWGTQWTMVSYLKKINKNENVKERKRSWGPFRIYQLFSTANPALISSKRAGLAVLISW